MTASSSAHTSLRAAPHPNVAVLILNWNGWKDTLECLEALFKSTYPNFRAVVLDNKSENDSVARIREWAAGKTSRHVYYDRRIAEQGGLPQDEEKIGTDLHPVVVIQTGANLGFAGGNNVGLRYALKRGADYVLLLNNDALLRSPSALSSLVEFMEQHSDAGAAGGRLVYPDGTPQTSYGRFPTVPHTLACLYPLYKLLPAGLFDRFRRSNIIPSETITEPVRIDYPSGACLLVRRKAIEEVGLLDERFFMYAEETDWCLRMMKSGWDRYYVPQAEVAHKYAASFGTGTLKMRRYHLESLFKYFRKHVPPFSLAILAFGYFIRALFSVGVGTIAARASGDGSASARSEVDYWSFVRRKSLELLKELMSFRPRERDIVNAP